MTTAPLDLLETPLEGGTTVIEASAGTGKTYCLTGLVLRLLLERRVESIGQILVVTFTNAATDELVARLRSALRDAHRAMLDSSPAADPFVRGLVEQHRGAEGADVLRDALLDLDGMLVSTIHGFCRRVLEESAFESGSAFDPELVEDDDLLRLDAARDAWRRLLSEDETGQVAQLAAAKGLTPERFAAEVRETSRHPEIQIVPEPRDVAEAAAELSTRRAQLAATWRGPRMRLFLSRRRWKTGADLSDAGAQRAAVAAVDDFCRGTLGPTAIEELTTHRVAEQLREPADELTREPALAVIDAVAESTWQLQHAVCCRMVADVSVALAQAKERAGILAFDDLVHRLDRALGDPLHGPRLRRSVRQTLRVALVDEFQDTDLVQYRIFRRLFDDGPLYLVGDPKQAIYRFRGADVFAYLEAKRAADRIYTLDRNWRSSGDLVRAVNALFEVERPFVYRDIPYPGVQAAAKVAARALSSGGAPVDAEAPLQVHWLGEEASARRAEARLVGWTSTEVSRMLAADLRLTDTEDQEGRPLRPADLAVLVRTNDQALAVQDGLRRAGIPAVVSRSGDIFHSEEVEELERVLRAILDPSDRVRLKTACATRLWGMDAAELFRLSQDSEELEDADRWQRLFDTFEELREVWREEGFVSMARHWLDSHGVRERLLKLDQGERRLTNLLHGVEVLARAIHDERRTPAGLVAWLAAERRRASHDRDAAELRLESDAEAVEISTVHKAKGLEYEVVLCPFLWQARSVDAPPVTVHVSSVGLLREHGSWPPEQGVVGSRVDRHLAAAEAERLAEDLRLVYVALTRARRRCLVAWGAIGRGAASSASGLAYLLHRRQQVVDSDLDAAVWSANALDEARRRVSDWFSDLTGWAEHHASLVEIRSIETEVVPGAWQNGSEVQSKLQARELPMSVRRQLKPWQISSFSSLSRAAHGESSRELPDRADPSRVQPPVGSGSSSAPQGIFAFARGPRAGQCLHDILENLDFAMAADPQAHDQVADLVRRQLQRFGLAEQSVHDDGSGPWVPEHVVVDLLRRLVQVALPDGPRLRSVERGGRLAEWQFWAPLRPVAAADLADCFRSGSRESWVSDYADRLATLSPREVEGFLTGYVDLVFEWQGRFYVVDWKSNHLGNSVADYDSGALMRAMAEHHYFLQYHLYVVALLRYLRSRGDSRDYDEVLGAVYYVFLRGIAQADEIPAAGQLGLFAQAQPDCDASMHVSAETGIFCDRPSRELIEELDALLFGPARKTTS
ncbi:MAG: exodeoxyribonuclease V subunit beta [Thermoanaerobaculia bacterium]|nr:exodeoxyribonuclease V subunit beta [Thermoanaerobaculia bacterium]